MRASFTITWKIPGMVTRLLDATFFTGLTLCSPTGEVKCDRAHYGGLLPEQTGPAESNRRGGSSPGDAGVMYDGAPCSPLICELMIGM